MAFKRWRKQKKKIVRRTAIKPILKVRIARRPTSLSHDPIYSSHILTCTIVCYEINITAEQDSHDANIPTECNSIVIFSQKFDHIQGSGGK